MSERVEIGILCLGICWILACPACAALRDVELEPCPPSRLAALETAYVLEAVTACKAEGAKLDDCKAFPAIRDKYRTKRAAYVECKWARS